MGGFDALAAQSVPEALTLARARAGPGGLVVVLGSLYVVAEARAELVPPDERPGGALSPGDDHRRTSG